MNRQRAVLPGLLLLCAVAVLNPPAGDACGPFFPEVSFVYEHEPGPDFLRGELGIVKPGYYRRHLIVAYRYLSGAPLTPGEVEAFQPRESIQVEAYPGAWTSGSGHWLKARAAVPDVPKLDRIDVFANRIHGTMYFAFQNCLDDAFESAVATLSERSTRWGANSPLLAEWLRGQDQVFSNCSLGPRWDMKPQKPGDPDPFPAHIPSQLPTGTDPTLLADREYQIAAARFYSGHYHAAAEAFSAIAADVHSTWQSFGTYLAARSLLRAGTVDDDKPALLAAEKAFQAIVADPKQSRVRDSASGLLDYARGHLYSEDRMVELGDVLAKPAPGPSFEAALTDYTMLWDRLQHGPAGRSDLADWITTLEAGNAAHALERWHNGGGSPWLVAALGAVQSLDADTQPLLVAARKLGPADPAYASAAYYGVRLNRAAGQLDEARAWADEALAAKLPLSAKNDLLHLRTLLARNWTEFLRFTPRRPVVYETGEADLERLEPASKSAKTHEPEPTFDADALDAFNRIIPLSLWIDATANPLLPKRLQAAVTDSAWVRAVLLGRGAEARALAGTLARGRPKLAVALHAYAAQSSAADARFDAVFLLLRTPGLSPLLHFGYGRVTLAGKIDSFHDNWWELRQPGSNSSPDPLQAPKGVADSVPQIFLSSTQRAAGDREWAALAGRAGVATNFLCAETLTWAKSHPGDPRLPEALHLAVRATRYGPKDKSTRDYSRQSFELLHRRFPNSEWVRKTKYWY